MPTAVLAVHRGTAPAAGGSFGAVPSEGRLTNPRRAPRRAGATKHTGTAGECQNAGSRADVTTGIDSYFVGLFHLLKLNVGLMQIAYYLGTQFISPFQLDFSLFGNALPHYLIFSFGRMAVTSVHKTRQETEHHLRAGSGKQREVKSPSNWLKPHLFRFFAPRTLL